MPIQAIDLDGLEEYKTTFGLDNDGKLVLLEQEENCEIKGTIDNYILVHRGAEIQLNSLGAVKNMAEIISTRGEFSIGEYRTIAKRVNDGDDFPLAKGSVMFVIKEKGGELKMGLGFSSKIKGNVSLLFGSPALQTGIEADVFRMKAKMVAKFKAEELFKGKMPKELQGLKGEIKLTSNSEGHKILTFKETVGYEALIGAFYEHLTTFNLETLGYGVEERVKLTLGIKGHGKVELILNQNAFEQTNNSVLKTYQKIEKERSSTLLDEGGRYIHSGLPKNWMKWSREQQKEWNKAEQKGKKKGG